MPYRWEPNAGVSGRYRDERGRFVAGSQVRRELDRYLDNSDPAKALAEALRGRQLSLADAEIAFRRMIKNTHLNAIALERGGWANMTPADYGRAGQIIREQYGYLKNFAADIASGKQRLDGTLGVRAKLYTQAGRESFYRSKQANLAAGVDMVRSVRHARDSCSECVSLDGKWFRVGDPTYKLPGQRICTKNCRCSEEYGRQTADGVEALEGDLAHPTPQTENESRYNKMVSEGIPENVARSLADRKYDRNSWEVLKPWEATIEDIEAGKHLGIKYDPKMIGAVARNNMSVDGTITLGPGFFRVDDWMTPGDVIKFRQQVLYHEAGHDVATAIQGTPGSDYLSVFEPWRNDKSLAVSVRSSWHNPVGLYSDINEVISDMYAAISMGWYNDIEPGDGDLYNIVSFVRAYSKKIGYIVP